MMTCDKNCENKCVAFYDMQLGLEGLIYFGKLDI